MKTIHISAFMAMSAVYMYWRGQYDAGGIMLFSCIVTLAGIGIGKIMDKFTQ